MTTTICLLLSLLLLYASYAAEQVGIVFDGVSLSVSVSACQRKS